MVHDLSSATVVCPTPRGSELDARESIVGGDEEREPVGLPFRIGWPRLQHLGRVALDGVARGGVRRERPDRDHGHGIAVLAFELSGNPFEIDLMERGDQPRLVDDETARLGSGRERHRGRAGARERNSPEEADHQGDQ
jgi:hypothetical protein